MAKTKVKARDPISAGDVVCLISDRAGDVAMTVEAIKRVDGYPVAKCSWFDRNHDFYTRNICTAALRTGR